MEPTNEPVTEMLTKATPPLAVTSLTFFGVNLPDIVQIITLVYLGIMLVDKLYVMYQRYKHDKQKENDEPS